MTELTLRMQAYELCMAIEELPASEQATNLSVLASALLERINQIQRRIDEPPEYPKPYPRWVPRNG